MDIVAVARVCHEANRAYCRSIGDDSQLAWDDAPQWQRDSAEDGVRIAMSRMLSPRELHAEWMAYKRREGGVTGR